LAVSFSPLRQTINKTYRKAFVENHLKPEYPKKLMVAIEKCKKSDKSRNCASRRGFPANMRLSIVIPAYNEEKRIESTLKSLVDRFDGICEILIVSESTDRTDDIVTEFSENSAIVKLITSEKRLGKGGAFKKGVENSQGEIVMLLDSDLPVPVSDVEEVVSRVGKADVAVASREVAGTKILVYPPRARVFAGKAFSRIFNALFDLNVRDTQCGCKAFKKSVLDRVLDTVDSNGFEFDAELLFKCKRMGCSIEEIPVTWSYKSDSKLNLFRDTIKMGKGVLKLWVKTYIVTQKS
jgi:glycosyltransferase involved in cell wall biosynthesis